MKNYAILLVAVFVTYINLSAQDICSTVSSNEVFTMGLPPAHLVAEDEEITVRLSFHVIADDDGVGGISQEEIENIVIPSLDYYYGPVGINFCLYDYSQTTST
ncbi:MAG: hypothetical protein AAF193_02920, partial [Bacteroidota bacterium]